MFQSTHNLTFETAPYYDSEINVFKIGTLEGLYSIEEKNYVIVSIRNNNPGNGHFNDFLDTFEYFCKMDGKNLKIINIDNPSFLHHLITKRGFEKLKGDNVIKVF